MTAETAPARRGLKVVQEATGVTARQLLWWRKQGLLGVCAAGNKWHYTPSEMRLVRAICDLRRAGLSLQRIRLWCTAQRLRAALPRLPEGASVLVGPRGQILAGVLVEGTWRDERGVVGLPRWWRIEV